MKDAASLLAEVRDARAKYASLSDRCLKLTRDAMDAPSSDGTLATAHLLREYAELRVAFDVYSSALDRYADAALAPPRGH